MSTVTTGASEDGTLEWRVEVHPGPKGAVRNLRVVEPPEWTLDENGEHVLHPILGVPVYHMKFAWDAPDED